MKTEFAKDIERAGELIQYDIQCKRVLSNKVILAWIMRETIDAYADMTVDEIVQCIAETPQVEAVHVEPGHYTSEKIECLNTEDKDEDEGIILYDIRFVAYVPKDQQKIKILLNVEAQKDFYPKYPIPSRGVYYGARMVSSQNGVEFKAPYYGDIKKVYSIWICMNAPKYIGNAISIIEFHKRDVVSSIPIRCEDYDKIAIVMVCLNEEVDRGKGFFDMMNTLLSPEMEVMRKKQVLEKDYGILMDDGLGKELESMGPFTAYAIERVERGYERGMEKGIKEGMEKGIKEGMEKGIKEGIKVRKEGLVTNLLKEGSLSDEKIMVIVELTEEEFQKIKDRVTKTL